MLVFSRRHQHLRSEASQGRRRGSAATFKTRCCPLVRRVTSTSDCPGCDEVLDGGSFLGEGAFKSLSAKPSTPLCPNHLKLNQGSIGREGAGLLLGRPSGSGSRVLQSATHTKLPHQVFISEAMTTYGNLSYRQRHVSPDSKFHSLHACAP